ncbi:copper chaperone [Porifericola rhodea]|uniref:heavy-metal-associated domain-containing protein n=1 Tax=Porifericola rhodea TaxID=930972 RepID=UPI00266705BB|nr:copper chaperone [Porifericola rhodea]WKN31812.1 copper chaperone [Porifericola rhodea]
MKTYKFKTNINCGGCVETVASYLDNSQDILQWEVDTQHEDKVLSVMGKESLEPKDVVDIINLAGFSAKPLKKGILTKLFGS